MGCLEKCREKTESVFHKIFSSYGELVGTRPWIFVTVCVLINGLLGLGLLRLNTISGIERLYVPRDSQTAKDRVSISGIFPDKTEANFFQHQLLNDGKYGEIIVQCKDHGNVLRNQYLDEIELLINFIKNISFVNQQSGSNIDLETVCARNQGICVITGDFLLSTEFRTDLASNNISYPVHSPAVGNPLYLSSILGRVEEQGGILNTAGYLKIRFHLSQYGDNHTNLSEKWEKEFIDEIPRLSQNLSSIEIAFSASSSLDTELSENTGGDVTWFSLTIAMMITYASVVASGGNCVSSRGYLAMGGVLAAGLGILSGMGLVCLCGLPFIDIVGVMPFLVLGIGVDDTFVMMSGWSENHGVVGIPQRLAATLASGGLSITVTSFTDVIAFCIGASSPFQSVQIFCVYTGISILFCYVNQMTLFAGCLAIHGRRVEQNRHSMTCIIVPSKEESLKKHYGDSSEGRKDNKDSITTKSENELTNGLQSSSNNDILPTPASNEPSVNNGGGESETSPKCDRKELETTDKSASVDQRKTKMSFYACCRIYMCSGDPPSSKYQEESVFEKGPRHLLPYIVRYLPVKVVICLLFCVYLGVSIKGVVEIQEGLDLHNLVAPSSYFYKYALWNEQHFQESYVISLVATQTLPYHENSTQTKLHQFILKVKASKYVDNNFLLFWMDAYLSSPLYNSSAASSVDFNLGLRNFLIMAPQFENDVNFNTNYSQVSSSRFFVKTLDIASNKEKGDMMLEMRKLAKASGLPLTAYSPPFIYFEQYVAILSNTLQTVGIAIAAMFVLSVVFIPHLLLILYITIAMVTILLGIFGFMYFWDLTLSSITMIHLVMSVGFSVDYCAHICHAVLHSTDGMDTRQSVVARALEKIGGPILNGAISSLIGVVMLVNSESYVFRSFFKVMVLVISFGILHSLFFLPVFLSLTGPKPKQVEKVLRTPSDSGSTTLQSNTNTLEPLGRPKVNITVVPSQSNMDNAHDI